MKKIEIHAEVDAEQLLCKLPAAWAVRRVALRAVFLELRSDMMQQLCDRCLEDDIITYAEHAHLIRSIASDVVDAKTFDRRRGEKTSRSKT